MKSGVLSRVLGAKACSWRQEQESDIHTKEKSQWKTELQQKVLSSEANNIFHKVTNLDDTCHTEEGDYVMACLLYKTLLRLKYRY